MTEEMYQKVTDLTRVKTMSDLASNLTDQHTKEVKEIRSHLAYIKLKLELEVREQVSSS